MHQEVGWLSQLAPEMIKVIEQRFLILKNIAQVGPIGRRSLAQNLGISERVLRAETDLLRKQELITVNRLGMSITYQGNQVLTGLAHTFAEISGTNQLEKELAQKLAIESCYIVNGDSDLQPQVIKSMGKLVNDLLSAYLPKGENIISVMGGTTIEQVSRCLTPLIAQQRTLTFVPARGGIGERVDIQANNVSAQMARFTKSNHRSLYVPEHVSADTFRSLLNEPSVQEVVQLIEKSNVMIHSIGKPLMMAQRRSMSEETIQMLKEKQAVSETFGCFFNSEGEIVYKIPRIGIQLEKLSTMDLVMAVAGGKSKAQAIAAYMKNAPSNTCLITDEGAAKAILKK